MPELLNALIQMGTILIYAMIFVIIGQVIISWLLAFNVINTQNDSIRQFLYWLDRITDPIYRPIRAVLPDFGGLDFSPIIVLLVLNLLLSVLAGIQVQ